MAAPSIIWQKTIFIDSLAKRGYNNNDILFRKSRRDYADERIGVFGKNGGPCAGQACLCR